MRPKFCTHCGRTLRKHGRAVCELYDEELFASSKILKLLECEHCRLVADKYVEYEGTLVLVDLVLQSSEAYRHVLLNGDYEKLLLKMMLLSIICDGYIGWASLDSAGEFFEQEYDFYIICLRIALGLICFVATVALIFVANGGCRLRQTFFGLLLAYSARFCYFAAFLWASPSEDDSQNGSGIMWSCVYLLFFVATVKVIQVTQNRKLLSSLLVSGIAHVVFNAVSGFDRLLQYRCF